jgi:hypothetical protein
MENRFTDLIEELIDNPEKVCGNEKTNDEILELYKQMNPYSYVPVKKDLNYKKLAVTSFTNLREDYLRRFSMTSMVGFVYQMASEYEVPAESRRFQPKKSKKAPEYKPFTFDELSEKMSVIQELIAEGQKADPLEAMEHLFTVTNLLMMFGEEARKRFPAVHDSIKDTPKAKELFEKFPEEIKKLKTQNESTIEVPVKTANRIITEFIDSLFKYDPNVHVRSAKANKNLGVEHPDSKKKYDLDDPECVVLQNISSKMSLKKADTRTKECISIIMAKKLNYNAASIVLNNAHLTDAVVYFAQNKDTYNRYLRDYLSPELKSVIDIIPSQDIYHRWNFYTSVNYEGLRKATEAIYHDKPDLDWAIYLMDTFEGTEEQVKNKYQAFKDRYESELLTSIKTIEYGGWTFLADFKENRDAVDIYNKKTTALQKIIEQHEKDEKIGDEILKNRVKVKKAKNIAEAGPDHPALGEYRSTMQSSSGMFGAQKALSTEEMKRLEAAKGNLEVARELEHIDNLRKDIKSLEDKLEKDGQLSANEQNDLNTKKNLLVQAIELLDVPDDAVQVDVFVNEGDTLSKSVIYTKHDGVLQEEYNKQTLGTIEESAEQSVTLGDEQILINGQKVDKSQLAPFAQAFYNNAKSPDDMSKMVYIEEEKEGEVKGELKEL